MLYHGKRAPPSRIVLVGVSINALIGAATSALMLLHSDKVQSVLPWLAGGIGGVSWAHLNMIIYYAIFAIILAFFGIKHIRVLMLGDEMAKLLGHNVEKPVLFNSSKYIISWNCGECFWSYWICRSRRTTYVTFISWE